MRGPSLFTVSCVRGPRSVCTSLPDRRLRAPLRTFCGQAHAAAASACCTSMTSIPGFELARLVLEIKPDAVVVMTTGFVRAQDQERAFAMGIRALILKPDSVEELSDVLYRLLNEQKPLTDGT